MTLTVGDDTYATEAEYEAYAAAYGWTLTGDNEVNLRLGKRAIDLSYNWRPGYPTADEDAIKHAQIELAYVIMGGADPMGVLQGGAIKRKKEKVDVIEEEIEYADGHLRERAAYPAVDALVAPFVFGKVGAATGSIRLVRV